VKNGALSGEDKVIVACVAMLTVLTVVALVAVTMTPANTNTIIPIMAGTVIAISSLAARHPPTAAASTANVLPTPSPSPNPVPPPENATT